MPVEVVAKSGKLLVAVIATESKCLKIIDIDLRTPAASIQSLCLGKLHQLPANAISPKFLIHPKRIDLQITSERSGVQTTEEFAATARANDEQWTIAVRHELLVVIPHHPQQEIFVVGPPVARDLEFHPVQSKHQKMRNLPVIAQRSGTRRSRRNLSDFEVRISGGVIKCLIEQHGDYTPRASERKSPGAAIRAPVQESVGWGGSGD